MCICNRSLLLVLCANLLPTLTGVPKTKNARLQAVATIEQSKIDSLLDTLLHSKKNVRLLQHAAGLLQRMMQVRLSFLGAKDREDMRI